MHNSYRNLLSIHSEIKKELEKKENKNINPKVIAVSKTFPLDQIKPLIDKGHIDFGENKVQEAEKKWREIKNERPNIQLHLVGRLQSNKVKNALKIFDYIHSLDSYKLAEIISKTQKEINLKLKFFIQINIGKEPQKSGIDPSEARGFLDVCVNKFSLDIIGLMCIPPFNTDSEEFFIKMKKLKDELNLSHLSMGMSNDYLKAVKFDSTFVRVGTKIFGKRE